MTEQGEEHVTARLEFECGYTEERSLLLKHRRQFLHAGRECLCPIHDVMEMLVAVEETWVEGGGKACGERLSE